MMAMAWLRFLFVLALANAATAAHALVFAVNEGVTYRNSNDDIRARYATVATDLGRILRQPVTIEPVADYSSRRKGLSAREYDLALVHPAHLSVMAIRSNGYHLIAVTKGYQNYTASFLVRADSTAKTLADLKDGAFGAPEENSITAWMVRASLRDTFGGTPPVRYFYTRFQDAVPFFVDNGLTKSAATASDSVVKAWLAEGGRVLAKSKPVPIKHMLASPALSADQVLKVREYLVGLDGSEEGRKKLEGIKYQGFAPHSEADILAIGKWLGL